MKSKADIFEKTKPAKGESLVWLSALGLALGVLMVVGILGLIAYQGLNAFWPKRVALMTMKPVYQVSQEKEVPGGVAGSDLIGGEIARKQVRHWLEDGKRMSAHEQLVFIANRDVYGESFRWIDTDNIEGEPTYPSYAMKLDRAENPAAIVRPIELQLVDGSTIAYADPQFGPTLERLTDEAAERRDEIHHVEHDELGRNSRRIKTFTKEIELLREEGGSEDKIKEFEALLAEEQARFDELMAELKSLNALQAENTMVYQTFDGQERSITMGGIIHYYYPNQLGLGGRIATMLNKMWTFVSENPRESNTEGGIFPAIFGTFVMTILMCVIVTPFGVIAAVYLHEYAKQGAVVRAVRVAINNLAGVPSIVFGVFGLGFFVYVMGGKVDDIFFPDADAAVFKKGGILWAALTLALLTVPVVIVATEEALASVPRGAREGSLALGASKWQTIWNVVLPASAPGIMTGVILSMARGAGEVAPLMLVGVVKNADALPINDVFPYVHLQQSFMHLGFHIYDLGFQSPDSEAAKPMVFATTLLLILLVVTMNLSGIIVRERLRRKYKTNTF